MPTRASSTQLWSPMHLERLARTYWKYLSRDLARAHPRRTTRDDERAVVFLTPPVRAAALPRAGVRARRGPRHRALAHPRRAARRAGPRRRLPRDRRPPLPGRARRATSASTSRSRSRTSTRRSRRPVQVVLHEHAVAHPRARHARVPASGSPGWSSRSRPSGASPSRAEPRRPTATAHGREAAASRRTSRSAPRPWARRRRAPWPAVAGCLRRRARRGRSAAALRSARTSGRR